MRTFVKICYVGMICIILSACQGNVASKQEGNDLAVKYLNATIAGNYDEAFSLVSEDFFQMRGKDTWTEYLNEVQKIMGPVISIKLSRSLVDDRFSGRFYMFQFSVKHENGFTTEMITMLQKINSKDPLKVFGHKIDSSKLKKLNARY